MRRKLMTLGLALGLGLVPGVVSMPPSAHAATCTLTGFFRDSMSSEVMLLRSGRPVIVWRSIRCLSITRGRCYGCV